MSKKPKMGRPKLAAKDKKQVFPIRFSKSELFTLKVAAGSTPLREWMRSTLLHHAYATVGMKTAINAAYGIRPDGMPPEGPHMKYVRKKQAEQATSQQPPEN